MDYMSIIAMALLEHLSEIFERMEKKIVKSKFWFLGEWVRA
jgi:hypothetical protein